MSRCKRDLRGLPLLAKSNISRTDPAVQALALGTIQVVSQGVTVSIDPGAVTVDPRSGQSWDVTITNSGEEADTFDLVAGGLVSSTARFSANPVALAAGASTVIQLTADPLEFGLAASYPFAVTAQSQADPDVSGYDIAQLTLSAFEAVAVEITPTLTTLTAGDLAYLLVLITNTGNVDTIYTLGASATPSLARLALETDEVYIPPHMTAGTLLGVQESLTGMYTITVQATSASTQATATDVARVTYETPTLVSLRSRHIQSQAIPWAGLVLGLMLVLLVGGLARARRLRRGLDRDN